MDQLGEVANPARGQLNRGKYFFPCPRSRQKIWSRETGSAVPSRVSLLILHHQTDVRRLRSFVQIVRARLPSQAIDLAVRVGGKESDV